MILWILLLRNRNYMDVGGPECIRSYYRLCGIVGKTPFWHIVSGQSFIMGGSIFLSCSNNSWQLTEYRSTCLTFIHHFKAFTADENAFQWNQAIWNCCVSISLLVSSIQFKKVVSSWFVLLKSHDKILDNLTSADIVRHVFLQSWQKILCSVSVNKLNV